jgi:surface polysaccharide O-acyltransferase-like enzyme
MDWRICLLRVLACFMVIQLHVAGELFTSFGPGWEAGNVYDSLVRASVPLFFMTARATMLRRDEPVGVFVKKRVLRILPPMLFWSAFYLWWLWYNGAGPANWIMAILTGPTMHHLWYFYAVIGIYAAIPILRKFYLHSSRAEHVFFLVVWLAVASMMPTAHTRLFNPICEGGLPAGGLASVYHFSYYGGYVGFLVLGAYIADSRPSRKAGWLLFLGASVGTMLATYFLSKQHGAACEFFYVYLSPLVVVAAYGLFSVVMSARERPAPRWLATLSDCTLGIYGLHVFVMDPVFKGQGWKATEGNPWISPLLVATGVFALSFVVVYAVRCIKPLRRIV